MMGSSFKKTFAILIIAAFILPGMLCISSEESSAATDTSFTITDGTGTIFNFDGPVEHVITFGYATTLTVAESSNVSKIIACDSYSQYDYYKDSRLAGLNAYNLGSPFAKDFTAAFTWILQAVENGLFDKEKDAIIATNSTSVKNYLYPLLAEHGFKNILFWSTFDDFSGMVDCINSISKVAGGVDNDVQKEVNRIYNTVIENVSKKTEKVDFIYLWYSSSNGIGIGSDYALGSSLIISAGGNNIASDVTTTSGSFGYNGTSAVLQYLEKNPDAVIFLADNFDMTEKEFADEYLGGDMSHPIKIMGVNWNNYCLDAVKGLAEVENYLNNVQGEGNNGENNNNTTIIVVIAIIILIIAALAAYVILKKKKK